MGNHARVGSGACQATNKVLMCESVSAQLAKNTKSHARIAWIYLKHSGLVHDLLPAMHHIQLGRKFFAVRGQNTLDILQMPILQASAGLRLLRPSPASKRRHARLEHTPQPWSPASISRSARSGIHDQVTTRGRSWVRSQTETHLRHVETGNEIPSFRDVCPYCR